MSLAKYRLGCPAWSDKAWVGTLFPPGTKPSDFLYEYARVFNAVEGNTTFYALPKPATVERWREETPDDFRFFFKLPSVVTHERGLVDAWGETHEFLSLMEPLENRLGPFMVQLPPSFGPERLEVLAAFLDRLPKAFSYAVELRHRAFFAGGPDEDRVRDLLGDRGVDTVILDARGLHQDRSSSVADVQRRKPNLPLVLRVTGDHPIVRVVPHADFDRSRPLIEGWLDVFARWVTEQKMPTLFMHAPDNAFAPHNAYRVHGMLKARGLDVGALPPWGPMRAPARPPADPAPNEGAGQLDLFGQLGQLANKGKVP